MNIKTLREKKELSQASLAQILGIDQSTITKWETKKALPRAALLPKLASVLGCTIDDLFREEIDAS